MKPEPDAELEPYSRLLGAEERDRAARFRFPHLTHRFIVDHGRVRLILGACSEIAPEDIAFAVNEYGKPELANPGATGPGRLRFNLSHTEGLTLLALCLDADLGVDVEAVRAMNDLELIAESHFSSREIAALRAVDPVDRERAFFRCWTRKEAFLKAHGRGLSIPLDSFAVSLAAEALPALLECRWDPEEIQRWSLLSLDPGPNFVSALAIRLGDWRICWLDWANTR
ncbi:MAG: 4'-phosphopantetheinyl transferase superfamily protein [Silvibacterium sp.]|nr:4'-phosphopantetheinyl transferase superfamily protein [Silvibacterium sp.]